MVKIQSIETDIDPINLYYFKGKQWLLIFHHNITNQTYFSDESEARISYKAGKYSLLEFLNDELKISSKYEFLLKYDSRPTEYNMWKQTNNPLQETENLSQTNVTGYDPIYIGYNNIPFGGLAKIPEDTAQVRYCFLNGNIGDHGWFFAIGQYNVTHDGWDQFIASDNAYTDKCVWLYVRLPPKSLRIYFTHDRTRNDLFSFKCGCFLFLTYTK